MCGKVQNGERLERIAKASAKLVTGKHPKGELIVRTDGTFLSVAYEYAGQVSEAAGDKITFTLDFAEAEVPVFLIRLTDEA